MMWPKRKLKNWVDDAYDEDESRSAKGVSIGIRRDICEDHSRPEDVENYTLTVWRATGLQMFTLAILGPVLDTCLVKHSLALQQTPLSVTVLAEIS